MSSTYRGTRKTRGPLFRLGMITDPGDVGSIVHRVPAILRDWFRVDVFHLGGRMRRREVMMGNEPRDVP